MWACLEPGRTRTNDSFVDIAVLAAVGAQVAINIGATISHDTVIGDYATVSPGVSVAGSCRIGSGAFLGVGSVVSDGVSIPEGTIVGAGAVVIRDIDEPGVYVGYPAVKVSESAGWLMTLSRDPR